MPKILLTIYCVLTFVFILFFPNSEIFFYFYFLFGALSAFLIRDVSNDYSLNLTKEEMEKLDARIKEKII